MSTHGAARDVRTRAPAPERTTFTAVKLTGTNGKGSVAAMLEAVLLADGQRPGLFTSPHLERPSERIRVAGAELDPDRFERELAEFTGAPSYFDQTLAAALRAFARERAEIAILEVAIGGRRDPVSRVPGPLSAITSIGLDHQELLGDTPEAIAAEKAGIASDGSTLVLGPRIDGAPLAVIERDARPRGVAIRRASLAGIEAESLGLAGWRVRVQRPGLDLAFDMPLAGRFQLDNLATAAELATALHERGLLRDLGSLAGVAHTRWPARLELVCGSPDWVLDSAHNETALGALVRDLPPLLGGRRVVALTGASTPERARGCLEKLAEISAELVLAGGFYRALDPAALAALAPSGVRVASCAASVDEAIACVRELCRPGDVALVAGSLYLAGAVRSRLLPRPA